MGRSSSSSWLHTGFFANLTNGVSQQPPRVRLASQQDEAVNMYPTTFHQMGHRGPLELVAEYSGLESWLDVASNGYPGTHSYVRDETEAYDIFFNGDGGIKIFDKNTGIEKTVTPSTSPYLVNADPERGFACLTYKDTTFVVNRSVKVAMSSSLSSGNTNPSALVRVKDWVSGASYTVNVRFGGVTISKTVNSGTDVNSTASALGTGISTHPAFPAGAVVAVYSNVIYITGPTLESVSVSDNRAGTAITSFMDSVIRTSDLTAYGPHGYVVRVTGASTSSTAKDANTSDDQFYRFEADDGVSGSGTWVETVAPGIKYQIDPSTAPHKLVRNSDGTFSFEAIDWGTRDVGDESTNPDPIFIGQTIQTIHLNGNRLGFYAGNQFIYSRVGEENYFEFFRSTTATALDDDPVYGVVPSTQVNRVYHPVAWNGQLIIFGDLVDGVVDYGSKFALSNLNISTPTASGISPICSPILSGSDLLFVTESGDFSNIGAYSIDPVTSLRNADSITDSYLGRYIPKNVKRMVGREKDFVAVFSTETRDKLYIMTYSKKANRLIQQGVVTWDFSNVPGMAIIDVSVYKNWLYVTYFGPGGHVYVGRIDVSVGASDTGFPRKCYLDHRMQISGTYDSGTDTTTFTLPFALTDGDKRLVVRSIVEGETRYAIGEVLTIASSTDTSIMMLGDFSGRGAYVGYGFNRYFVPNPIFARVGDTSSNSQVADMTQELNIAKILVGFFNTQHFVVEVVSRTTGRVMSRREFNLLRLDNVNAKLDDNGTTYTGVLEVDGLNASVDESFIRISSDSHLPFFIDTIQWLAGSYKAAG